MIGLQVQLTEEQDRQLTDLSKTRRVSKADLVRQAVDLLLTRDGFGRASEEQWQRALAVVGRFRSGEPGHDVAENHDQYLVKAYQE